ncbi:Nitrogenase FeMo-cofactor synthesis FeS core scaffold and assembly protein NifB [Caenispirillum salinarum AK4]|uniref:FeMo cofactor biosynthesis protein NifB n=1 Tax=Caenispirillum salinarum AK4 TaxID=1238182 RepID=K9GZ92_9PROT|nr:Nitrogenase FeMo-cofactor synthesis FeS core scaffold and assembly protein NifB [Caenispirillum salinarum AK4]
MSQVISLDSIAKAPESAETMRQDLAKGGCTSSSCGSSDGPADMPAEIWEKIKDHPCYSEEAHHYFARMHVAVAPACNIQCNYCNRKYDCANESRPGVVSERLTPEQAARKVIAVANEVPQLSVLGIAGPGDSLYDWKKTFETFELVETQLPDIKFCISTNGLALPDHVEEIARHNIDHVTITINMVDPEIGAKIYPWIFFDKRRIHGVEAARILHERQMQGLEMLTERGILVKVNSVMIPGINDEHLKVVNAEVKKRGAFLHNIMPLISAPEHGTHFGLTGQRGPTAAELKALQDDLADGANLMRHCRQCRADAVGLLGEDRGQEFTLDKIGEAVAYDPEKRRLYREVVEAERADHQKARAAAEDALAHAVDTGADAAPMLVAVTTKGGGRLNQHFGHATEFQVYEVDCDGVRFVGHRRADNYCLGGFGEDDRLETIIGALDGVTAVLTAKIGDCPRERLEEAGIVVSDAYAYEYIESSIGAYYTASVGSVDAGRASA